MSPYRRSRRARRQVVTRVRAAAVGAALVLTVGVGIGSPPASAAPPPTAPAPSPDVAVTGVGAPDGYHLYLSRAATGWQWTPLVTLAPGGGDDPRWVGNQCLTGDGRHAVAVVAGWHATNDPVGMDRGGTAYAVDLESGRVRVLASGVSLHYFDPGCGIGSQVALTRFLDGEQRTQVLTADAATGAVSSTTVTGEVTSTVPTASGQVGVLGTGLVRLDSRGAHRLATLPALGYQLRPNAVGGVDLLTTHGGTATAWRWSGRGLTRLGSGPTGRVALFAGRNGATRLTGLAGAPAHVPGLSTVAAGRRPAAVSSDGGAVLFDPPTTVTTPALPSITGTSGRPVRSSQPLPTGGGLRTTVSRPGMADGPSATAPLVTVSLASAPACSVPRNSLFRQVPQPSLAQVNWAIEEATRGELTGANARPANFDNLGGPGYSPSLDFPRAPGAGQNVPPQIVNGILAQESNWNQASWHALHGLSGNPLVADYYGNGGGLYIDYPDADCGYGIGQITDIMAAGAYDPTVQARVAVDYAENIAAVVQHLGKTFNTLSAMGITVNNNDPQWLENWYDTVWAYNSGINPQAITGNTTGCTPGPGCTDGDGNWGLGWSNNPQNPAYPPDRQVFLQESYADASHPGDWPYQERVFGWISTPLIVSGVDAYVSAGRVLKQPAYDAYCTAADDCDPASPPYCQRGDFHCWWHWPVTFADCSQIGNCVSGFDDVPPGQPEPAASNPHPPVCNLDTSQVPTSTSAGSTVIVSDEATPENPSGDDVNVAGCHPTNWHNAGSFSLTFGQDSDGQPVGEVDFHQLGAGFGGHMWFAHMRQVTDPEHKVTGTWTPDLPDTLTPYQIKVFVPDTGAVAAPATYTITPWPGATPVTRSISQADYSNQWVSLGVVGLKAGATVSLTNETETTADEADVAFTSVAFIPRPGRLVHHDIDAFANFDNDQSLNSGPPGSWLVGDFAGDDTITQMAEDRTSAILGMPECSGTPNSSCTPANLRQSMSDWQFAERLSGGHPVRWLGFSHLPPPNPLPPDYLDDPDVYKIRASLSVDYLVLPDNTIDPGSFVVTATNETGITHLPTFITDTFRALQNDYGVAPPDLSYTATNLQFYTGTTSSWDANATFEAPGRQYKPKLDAHLVNGNTCLQVEDITGGTIGWKPLLLANSVILSADRWLSDVQNLVSSGQAPQPVADLANTIYKDFLSAPADWPNFNILDPNSHWIQSGSIFYFAPAIWVEAHLQLCTDGSIRPAGNVDPDTNRAQLVDSSYMPDLYLAIDGSYVDKYGAPSNGAPVQRGDWPDFSVWPLNHSPDPSPWNLCYIGPTQTFADGSQIVFVSRRDGNPWGLPLLNPGDLSSTVNFC